MCIVAMILATIFLVKMVCLLKEKNLLIKYPPGSGKKTQYTKTTSGIKAAFGILTVDFLVSSKSIVLSGMFRRESDYKFARILNKEIRWNKGDGLVHHIFNVEYWD